MALVLFTNFLLATLSPTPALSYLNPGARKWRDATESSSHRTYIVLVEPPRSNVGEDFHRQWHESFLPRSRSRSHAGNSSETRLLGSYTEVFSGFAARLTEAEVDAVAKKPGFVRAFPDRTLQLATTHTPEFLGLNKGTGTGIWNNADYGKGVIIGVLDTGIHAAHPSFDDHGVPPPPARWKGSCNGTSGCNNKLIGAKWFVGGDAGDEVGHGTHTSSTAAGNFVAGASYKGVGTGTAAGIAPAAHIAMYKVCSDESCDTSAILAGMDEAIKDGVDVLSVSLAGGMSAGFDLDPIAIGAFTAVSKGITVVCAAGNKGPRMSSIANDAPWLLTVAAGSVDRSFDAGVYLGDGRRIDGEALTQLLAAKPKPSSGRYPLLFSKARPSCDYENNRSVVAGKILVCGAGAKIHSLIDAGAAGVLLSSAELNGYTTVLRDYNSSGVVQVTAADGKVLRDYASETKNSVVSITYNSTLLGVRPAPVVAWFSSRGPSNIAPGILKPDILAPGLNILAAWPPKTKSATGLFNIISGTSMSTPHVSGVVALVKSLHPDWSPAAIKSAILTTADAVNSTGGPILDEKHGKADACATGAGHVNPARAADPGLVYDITADEFAAYMCWVQSPDAMAASLMGSSLPCADLPNITEAQLNYPTIAVPLRPKPFTVNRTVTNVGPAESTYTVKVEAPATLSVHVSPQTLCFTKVGEKKVFSVSVTDHGVPEEELIAEGSLSWVSEKHVVRSPVVAVSPWA
uniref:Uncharacterized protein n=1 Tax=Avena sativa TaxID=4498 RepID=A0ACD5X0Q3_AVESA